MAELQRRELQEQAQNYRDKLLRQGQVWGGVEEAGRRAREADRARQGPDRERSGERSREREGPGMER